MVVQQYLKPCVQDVVLGFFTPMNVVMEEHTTFPSTDSRANFIRKIAEIFLHHQAFHIS